MSWFSGATARPPGPVACVQAYHSCWGYGAHAHAISALSQSIATSLDERGFYQQLIFTERCVIDFSHLCDSLSRFPLSFFFWAFFNSVLHLHEQSNTRMIGTTSRAPLTSCIREQRYPSAKYIKAATIEPSSDLSILDMWWLNKNNMIKELFMAAST